MTKPTGPHTSHMVLLLVMLLILSACGGSSSNDADKNFNSAVQRGDEALKQKDWERAETNYQEALRQHPDDPSVKSKLGKAQDCKKSDERAKEARDYLNNGSFEQAITALKKIAECDEDYPGIKSNLFAAYKGSVEQLFKDGKAESAVAPCSEALKLRADDPVMRGRCGLLPKYIDGTKTYQKAEAETQAGQVEAALTSWISANQNLAAVYEQDKRFQPGLPNLLFNTYVNIARLHEQAKRWCEAEETYSKAATVEGIDVSVANAGKESVTFQCRTPTPAPTPTDTPRPRPPPIPYCFVGIERGKSPYNPGLIRLRGSVIDKNGVGVPEIVSQFQFFNAIARVRTDRSGNYVMDGLAQLGPWNARLSDIRSVPVDVKFDDAGQQIVVDFVEQPYNQPCPAPR